MRNNAYDDPAVLRRKRRMIDRAVTVALGRSFSDDSDALRMFLAQRPTGNELKDMAMSNAGMVLANEHYGLPLAYEVVVHLATHFSPTWYQGFFFAAEHCLRVKNYEQAAAHYKDVICRISGEKIYDNFLSEIDLKNPDSRLPQLYSEKTNRPKVTHIAFEMTQRLMCCFEKEKKLTATAS